MRIERKENEIVISISSEISTDQVQQLVDYLRYSEIALKSKAKPSDLENLVATVKKQRRSKVIA